LAVLKYVYICNYFSSNQQGVHQKFIPSSSSKHYFSVLIGDACGDIQYLWI
jgi:hypothetical protein